MDVKARVDKNRYTSELVVIIQDVKKLGLVCSSTICGLAVPSRGTTARQCSRIQSLPCSEIVKKPGSMRSCGIPIKQSLFETGQTSWDEGHELGPIQTPVQATGDTRMNAAIQDRPIYQGPAARIPWHRRPEPRSVPGRVPRQSLYVFASPTAQMKRCKRGFGLCFVATGA